MRLLVLLLALAIRAPQAQEVLEPARGVILPEAAMPAVLKPCSRTGVPQDVTGAWTPEEADIRALDVRLARALRTALAEVEPTRDLHVSDYYRQYIGFVRSGGRRTVYANAFHASRLRVGPRAQDPDLWRTTPMMVCDGGTGYFGVEYDAAAEWLGPIHFNSSVGMVVPRFGTLAPSLTGDDMAQIRRLTTRMGGEVWVVFGDTGFLAKVKWSVAVYRRPEVTQGAVRTGVLLWITTDVGPRRTWAVDSVATYAQVALPGRAPDAIESDADPNGPFQVHGQWNADELADLVTFIRSSPKSSAAKDLHQVNGALPIRHVSRQGGAVKVSLRVEARVYQSVSLTRVEGRWVVNAVSVVAVD